MTQKKLKIKKGDEVIVIAGKDKGKKGSVLSVIRDTDRVVVAGVNMVTKHQKADRNNAGGIIKKEAALHISNVAIVDPKEGKPSRVGYKMEGEKKVRFAKLSGEVIAN
ncbi:MAG: 50S ribosomal protein L24 [Pseudomonadota bacterium]